LILSGITDETLRVSKSDVRRRGSVTLIVGDDFNTVMLPHTDTRVGGSEIDSDRWSLSFSGHWILLFFGSLGKKERKI
jgi:hypothetical protein